jgi:hypothetical protein
MRVTHLRAVRSPSSIDISGDTIVLRIGGFAPAVRADILRAAQALVDRDVSENRSLVYNLLLTFACQEPDDNSRRRGDGPVDD